MKPPSIARPFAALTARDRGMHTPLQRQLSKPAHIEPAKSVLWFRVRGPAASGYFVRAPAQQESRYESPHLELASALGAHPVYSRSLAVPISSESYNNEYVDTH